MALRMPVEHGAWGLLLVPLFCAAIVAGEWNLPLLLCAVAALALFLLRGSLEANRLDPKQPKSIQQLALEPGHMMLGILAVCCVGALLFGFRRYQLIPLGAAGAALYGAQLLVTEWHNEERTEKRSLYAELIGVVLLSLVAPAVWIAARGRLDSPGVELWSLLVLFFLGGILYVKFRVRGLLVHRQFAGIAERLQFAWPVIVYHFLLLALLICLVVLRSLSMAVLVAFVPGILRANGLVFQLGARFAIKRLGWTEVLHSVVFAALLIFAFR